MNTQSQAAIDPLLLRQDVGGVVTLTLNRPNQFNSLSAGLLRELQAALDAIAADPAARVVVIAGAGRAFCSGHDLKEMREQRDKATMQALFHQCWRVMTPFSDWPQVVIARVHGIATAAGCQLVAQCDLAVAAEEARFAVSGINVGLFCSTPAVALSRNLGRKQAMEMLLTGDFIDAREAQRRGLVNRVVAATELDAELAKLCASIVAKSPLAVATGKQMFYRQLEMGLTGAYQYAAEVMACNMMAEDVGEGLDAFMGKRPAQWKGC